MRSLFLCKAIVIIFSVTWADGSLSLVGKLSSSLPVWVCFLPDLHACHVVSLLFMFGWQCDYASRMGSSLSFCCGWHSVFTLQVLVGEVSVALFYLGFYLEKCCGRRVAGSAEKGHDLWGGFTLCSLIWCSSETYPGFTLGLWIIAPTLCAVVESSCPLVGLSPS